MTAMRTKLMAATVLSLLLAACGSRDTQVAESVMEAKQAADRAEAAQNAAERAASQVGRQPVVADAEPADEPEPQETESADPDLEGPRDDSELYSPAEPPTAAPQE